jgi:stage V sporulation protein B
MAVSGWLGYWLFQNFLINGHLIIRVLMSMAVMAISYFFQLLLFGLLKRNEIKRIPYIGKPLSKWTFR